MSEDVDRCKIYFSGLPKCTCQWSDIHQLFSRVAQIKKLWFSFEKGYGCITLYSESSVDFILQQNTQWIVNGCLLNLKRYNKRNRNNFLGESLKNSESQTFQKNLKCESSPVFHSSYKKYQNGTNLFWRDVPHEKSVMVRSLKKRKRRKWQEFDGVLTVQTCKTVKRKKKKWKIKKKKKLADLEHLYPESMWIQTRSIFNTSQNVTEKSSPNTKIQVDTESLCLASCCETLVKTTHDQPEENEHNSDRCADTSKELNGIAIDKKHKKESICPVQPDQMSIQEEVKVDGSCRDRNDYFINAHVPLYVRTLKRLYLMNVSYDSLKNVQDFVYEKEGIPPDVQMVIYQGKVVNQLWNPKITEPFRTVQVLVKGIGGMMDSASGSDGNCYVINKESTDNDVLKWLENVVNIPTDVICQYPGLRDLDGVTLLSYEMNKFHKLKKDIEVPIGLARKILLCLNSQFMETLKNSAMYTWTSEDLFKFLKESLGENENSILIESAMKEKLIDTMTFFSYKDSEELKTDLDITNVRGIIFQKLIAKRNMILGDSLSATPSNSTAGAGIKTVNKPIELEVAEDQENETPVEHRFLESGLGLLNKDDSSDFYICKLCMIFVSWTKANELERKFLFFIMCNEEDFKTKDSLKILWNVIRKSTKQWVDELNPKDKSSFPLADNSEDEVVYHGKKISLSQGAINSSYLLDKEIKKVLNFENHILLVNQKLLNSRSTHYKCVLSEKKNQSYCFALDENKQYWFFDPDDFADGFKKKQLSQFRLDYYQSCRANEDDDSTLGKANEQTVATTTYYPEMEHPRPFKEESTHILYHENRIISAPESDGTLSDRCFEFKYFVSSLNAKKDAHITKFVRETLRFSCGVLNVRKNGTIFFGVADNIHPIDGKLYKHGEIVGFPINEKQENECKTKYTDALRHGINKCFTKEVCSAALQCIGNPVFVTVLTSDKSMQKFVMEVDICSSSIFCERHPFRVNLAKFGDVMKNSEDEYLLFVRKSSTTTKLTGLEELLFIRTELDKLIKARLREEQESILRNQKCSRELPVYKLEKLFCDVDKFDTLMWPIFVLSKPSAEQKMSKIFFSNLTFLRKIKRIVAVFDFDDESNVRGLCNHLRNKDESELYDESIFREYSGNFAKLYSILNTSQEDKTMWIFSNGRSDTLSPKPHLQKQEWIMQYRSGVSDAINYFSQTYVIPKGRAMFVFVLFTSELEGIIDTFIDIIGRFSLEQVIVLAEKKSVYARFLQSVLTAGKIATEALEDRSITDVTWEEINSSLKSFLGEEEKGNCMIATSSGILMPVEERFLECLADVTVLSATQCENRKFTEDKKKEFCQKEEFNFYRGNKVSWWNFYFENHVLERHNFERLKTKVQHVLQSPIQDQRVVVTITLAHEPGAGGSTLAHHILWEFRKRYKCCIIKKITDTTHYNLLHLWQFKEANMDQSNPLLVLIDELSQTEFRYDELVHKIHTEFRKRSCPSKPFCCVILCHREEHLQELPRTFTEILREQLHQKLTDKEQIWLENKYKQLEKTGKDHGISGFKPEHLISFMILRKGFSQEFVRRTIKGLILKVQKSSNEFMLLKYTSLVSCYVSSKHYGPKVHIPHDCCDELMGSHLRKFKRPGGWAEDLSSTVKILLIIEEKKHTNGSQIRMAHPTLAKEVFDQIKEITGETVCEIASEFLESTLLKRNTHGQRFLEEITKEMLKRRKKLENQDKLTIFSPLVEDILQEENGCYENVAELLIKGFDIFSTDNVIAQTIARLYAKYKQFDSAAKWARDAVMLAPKSGKSYCMHTLGFVLKEKFLFTTNGLSKVNPDDAISHLKLAVEALQTFLEAQTGRLNCPSDHVPPYHDTINIINRITKFLKKNIKFLPDVDVKRYICDRDYIPEQLFEIWKDLHHDLKSLHKHGLDAFDVLEEYVCFNTVFRAHSHDEVSTRKRNEHSSCIRVLMQYPSMFSKFSEFFGEDSEEPRSFPSEDCKNVWHRRKALMLGGNSFMNIFGVIFDIKKRKLSEHDALDKLLKIKHELSAITKRNSRDLSNLACVNVALGLLDGKRESEDTIYKYCKLILSSNTYGVSLAHFLIIILFWPSSNMKVRYDDEQFQTSLKYLYNQNQQKYQARQSKSRSSSFRDDDSFVCQATTQFFLTKGEGLKSICNRWDIFFRDQPESNFNNAFWKKRLVQQTLKKLEGEVHFTTGCSSSFILLQNEKSDKHIEIRKLRTGKRKLLSQEEVTFYLGFSMAGPIAYNIKPKRLNFEDNNLYERESSTFETDFQGLYSPSQSEVNYLEKSVEELQKLVEKIHNIKRKTVQTPNEVTLLEDEDYIQTALDIKEDRDLMLE